MSQEGWSAEFDESTTEWCKKIALLAADALIDAQLIPRTAFDDAAAVIAEEIYARLFLEDYPPRREAR